MLRRPTNSQLIRWSIIIVAFLCSAVLLAYKPAIQIWHNSDSVTHALASHDTWTPYFWGQDRLGMFFSLLGMGIDDPVNNLLFLNVLFILFVFIMFPLWGYWLTRSKSGIYGGVLASILYSILGGNKAIFV